MMYRTADRQQV